MNKKSVGSAMVTVQEAAEKKGVTPSRIYQWIGEGRLETQEVFGRKVVDLKSVMSLQELKRGKPSKKDSKK
jgi:hypothetical protein